MSFTQILSFPPTGDALNRSVGIQFGDLFSLLNSVSDGTKSLDALTLGTAGVTTGILKFYQNVSTKFTAVQPGNASVDFTYTLPTAGPAANNYLLASSTSGTLSWLNAAGTYAPLGSAFVTIGSDATLTNERALTGTTNQVAVTDNGAGSTVVLSTPQNIHSGASPSFAGLNISGSILGWAGTGASQIAYSFTGDTDTGVTRISADDLGLVTGGSVRLDVTTTAITANIPVAVNSTLTVTDTTANALKVSSNQATTELSIDNTATDGDPLLSFKLSGTAKFSLGVNDGASDVLQLGTTAIDTGTMWQATVDGEITQPLQPSFLATAPVNTANVTGDGTVYTAEFDTEVFDQGNDFNTSTYTFTAPVTGRYFLQANMLGGGHLTTHTFGLGYITTSNRLYLGTRDCKMSALSDSFVTYTVSAIADMDAGDTAVVNLNVSGSTKVVELIDDARYCFFSGSLIN